MLWRYDARPSSNLDVLQICLTLLDPRFFPPPPVSDLIYELIDPVIIVIIAKMTSCCCVTRDDGADDDGAVEQCDTVDGFRLWPL